MMDRLMMNPGGNAGVLARIAPALTLALLASTAQAQSANDFRLPEPTPSSTQRAPGPVDPENPGASTPRAGSGAPAPDVKPAAAPAVKPAATPSPKPAPRATAAPIPKPASPAARAAITAASSPSPAPSAGPAPLITGPAAPSTSPAPSFPSLTPTAVPVPADAEAAWWWPYLAAGAAALAALFALLWWRQRGQSHETVVEFEMPVVAARGTVPLPAPPIPEPKLNLDLPPQTAPVRDGLSLTLEATRLSASLMATTLSYRLTLTNHGTDALAGLAIEGDMVSAHASLPPEQQLAQAGQALELRHALATLEAGESAEFSGDIRLPLTAITPIRAGEQAYFVPLARFRVEAGAAGGSAVIIARTFVVGDVPEGPQTTLRPFRLDLGPRTYSRVSQREVA